MSLGKKTDVCRTCGGTLDAEGKCASATYIHSLWLAKKQWPDLNLATTVVVKIAMIVGENGRHIPASSTYNHHLPGWRRFRPLFMDQETIQIEDFGDRFMGFGPRSNTLFVGLEPNAIA